MSDDEYEVPLRDQRMFGSGLKRKRIRFIPSSQPARPSIPSIRTDDEVSAAEKYLAIATRARRTQTSSAQSDRDLQSPVDQAASDSNATESDAPVSERFCEVCSKPIASDDSTLPHHSSLVHQICMKHSHPPSSVDRGRKGLAVLQSYGWDPDQRRGLGAEGAGVLHPIKAKENATRVGLGATSWTPKIVTKPVRLDAGKVRKAERDAQRRKDKLRQSFGQSDDVDRYLGQLEHRALST